MKSGIRRLAVAFAATLTLAALVGNTGSTSAAPVKQGAANQQNTVSIVSGTPAGTYLQIAYDLSAVLDDPEGIRVLPLIGKGGAQNIRDVLSLKGVDMGIAQTTDLNRLKENREQGDLSKRLVYIAKLYNEELHLLARSDIRSVQDLQGKTVNFSDIGGGTQFVARELFEKLGVKVREVNMGQADAIEQMKSGEVTATVYVAGKPGSAFARVPKDAGFHFLPVPYGPEFEESYYPATLESADYPSLVPEGQSVETIAVGAVLVAYNWPTRSARYKQLEAFVEAFFDKIDQFQKEPRHPKWREVNLAVDVPGWSRFEPATRFLQEAAAQTTSAAAQRPDDNSALKAEFERFAKERGLSSSDRKKVFDEFIQWREKAQ
ncbi:TAXI family TRAP transporter solute-binding subunit [Microvirga roseola]|uniref:TAXI family TRAP transporter solute-binding subunit n=1 Tax=Microvirga roseola TaxID=2883126 RepID=UPI001E5312E4|nr:TAXI family TRAP transporter solute-binding subunit [Microvirga roseola]